jgi:HD superfamily phosphohydrolase YqeK
MKKESLIPAILSSHFTERHREILKYLEKNVSPYRVEHTLSVAVFAQKMAPPKMRTDELIERLITAALFHDITKEEKKEFHLKILGDFVTNKSFISTPEPVLHGYSAAAMIQTQWDEIDAETIEAVHYHSTGYQSMSSFAKIIFGADFLASFPDKEIPIKEESDLNKICMEKIINSLNRLIDKKRPVQLDSILFYNALLNLCLKPEI